MEKKQEFYTLQEIADLLQVNVQTVRRKVREGKIKALYLGKSYRVSRAALEEYFNSIGHKEG